MEITDILVAGLSLICAFALVVIVHITGKTEKKSEALELIRIAVNAAEQVMKSETGSRKKQAVLDWLDTKGVKLDPDIVDKAIEAEVAKLKKGIESQAVNFNVESVKKDDL